MLLFTFAQIFCSHGFLLAFAVIWSMDTQATGGHERSPALVAGGELDSCILDELIVTALLYLKQPTNSDVHL